MYAVRLEGTMLDKILYAFDNGGNPHNYYRQFYQTRTYAHTHTHTQTQK